MQDAVPFRVELARAQDGLPGLPHDVVAGTILVADDQPQHFNSGSSAEQGENQRLDDADRASNRARVSPRFEIVGARDMPLRLRGCFVHRVPEHNRVRDLRHGGGEVEIDGGIEHRIAAEDDERLDRARVHRRDERGQRAHARQRRVLCLEVADRLAGVAERRVERADRRVDGRGLAFPNHDQPLAAVRQKVLGEGVDPARIDARDVRHGLRLRPRADKPCRERRDEGRDLPALETEPMIRHGSRQRVDTFHRVEPVHCATRGSRTPSGREASRVSDHLGVGQERIGVEGENNRRLIEPEHEVDVAPRGGPQAGEPVLVADRLVGRPGRLRVAGAEFGGQARKSGRGEGLGEDRKAGATIRRMRLGQLTPGRHEIVPGLRLRFQPDALRAVGIVEAEHRRLDPRARGPEGRGVTPGSLRSWSVALRGSRR